MKKIALCLALSTALMCSCSTIRTATSKSADVNTVIESVTTAELVISQEKIEFVYTPTGKEKKKVKVSTLTEKAVAMALKNSGNADVMVAPEFQIEKRGFKTRRIVVTGYPAKYKNFKSAI